MKALLEQISKDREKFIAFLQYLIDTGRLTEDEVISIVRQCQECTNVDSKNEKD
ncbi:hypothetical protein [Desulforamulus putei]|uniref:Uncharacterized protein n=1 Tax=Desulforamulus putei DSM 12395 TaxID=1121429 RepID=A0A1M4X1Z4_9FIRM|nr:hypothetical protein [Desulforamulus putei]SHE87450.1 hypothetical protein SAMN02745133_01338 [Desulforamulus putei DSM 12395]